MNKLSELIIPDHNIVVTLYDNMKYKGNGIMRRVYLSYTMTQNGRILFSGDDFSPSPMDSIDGLEAVVCLLSFLTTRPGDTDDEYFQDYTAKQLDFANSLACEELQSIPYDLESGDFDNYFNVTSNDSLPYENYTVTYK